MPTVENPLGYRLIFWHHTFRTEVAGVSPISYNAVYLTCSTVGALKGRRQSDAEKNICTWHLLSKRKRGCRDKQNARFHGPEYWLIMNG